MPIEVKALPKAEYAAWLAQAKEEFASNDIVPVQPEVTLASAK
jgi:heme/copper-type cytochrome/quinol oxidase subunit 2